MSDLWKYGNQWSSHLRSQYNIVIYLPNFRTATLRALTCLKCGYSQLYADKKGLKNLKEAVLTLAEAEGLKGHADAILARTKE